MSAQAIARPAALRLVVGDDAASPAPASRTPTLALELVRGLTLLWLLLVPYGPWWLRPLIIASACLGLILAPVRRSAAFWFVVTALVAMRVGATWPLADNHAYLLVYWCLAQALAATVEDPLGLLRRSGRWLLGLVFLMAVIYKVALTPEYRDGRFFRVTLLTDGRFENVAMLAGGMSRADIEESRAYLRPTPSGVEIVDGPMLLETPRLRVFAQVLTWATVAIEALVAAAFLAPAASRIAALRHVALLAFCAGTYALAPVAGFGWLLSCMGLSQCREDQRLLRACYVGAFLLMVFYRDVPWTDLLVRFKAAA